MRTMQDLLPDLKAITRFSEFMSAKFCHDMAGPVGAINNGLDFLADDDLEMRTKALELVNLSSKQAISRVTFFRQAYGCVYDGSDSNIDSIKALVSTYIEGQSMNVTFGQNTSQLLPNSVSKLLLNMILICSAITMYKGDVHIDVSTDLQASKLTFACEAKIIKTTDELKGILKGAVDSKEMTTRNVQYFYTYYLIRELGYSIDVIEYSDKVILSLSK